MPGSRVRVPPLLLTGHRSRAASPIPLSTATTLSPPVWGCTPPGASTTGLSWAALRRYGQRGENCSLLGLQQPIALVHPLLVMGGLILAFALNALPIVRIRVGHEDGALVGAVSLRLRGSGLNLIALSLSCLLFATITLYLFVENFRPR